MPNPIRVALRRKIVLEILAQVARTLGWRMPRSVSETAHFAAFGMSALNIGTWEDTPLTGSVRGDAAMARIFGLTEAEAAAGVSWERLSAIFHPEDLARDAGKRLRVRDEGGLFAWEHRILPAPGLVRWVLARGHFERGADGAMQGRGIVIDITDSRTEGQFDPPAGFLGVPDEPGSVLEQMADHALRISTLMRDVSVAEAQGLAPLIEGLLYELGRRIAAALSTEPADRRSRGPRPKVH